MIRKIFQERGIYFLTKWLFYLIIIIIFFSIVQLAQLAAQDKMKVLILTGGHGFETSQFFQMFESFEDVEYTEVQHPWANFSFDPNIAEQFKVFVFYDMVQDITPDQKEAFLKLLKKGKGMVFLHHSLASYQNWGEFKNIIGGQYYLEAVKRGEETIPKSTYQHDVDIFVKIVDPEHPVTRSLKDFIIHDEVYGRFYVSDKVRPLLTTDHPKSGKVIGWTNNYGNSTIVYIQLGHDHQSYENDNFRKLIFQTILFVASTHE